MARKSQPSKVKGSWIASHPRLVIGIILVLCLGPFVNKAVHTDDVLFVLAGQWIQKHPADFFGGEVNWWSSAIPMWLANYNPPLLSYFLAGVASIFGWSEIVLHLAGLAVAGGAALGIYALARMWCKQPLLATVVAIFTPAFLVSSTTLMCDVMMLGFWVWALVLWEQALQKGQGRWQFLGAGALAGLGILTKYSAVTLLPLLLLLAVLRTRKPGWWLLGLAVPVFMLAGYDLATGQMYGRGLFSSAVHYAQTTHITFPGGWRASGIIDLAFVGGSLLPLLFFVPWLWRPREWLAGGVILLGGLLVSFGLCSNVKLNNAAPDLMQYWGFVVQAALLTAGGLHVLLLMAAETWRRRDAVTLTLVFWAAGTICFATVLNWTVNVRSFLPAVPAAAILLARRLEAFPRNRPGDRRRLWPLVPAGAVALAVAAADYLLANSARTAAAQIMAKYKSPDHTVWFEGNGAFQYYMEKLGGVPVDIARSGLHPADIVVVPEIGIVVHLPPGSVGWVDHVQYGLSFGVNIMGGDQRGLAGFYGAHAGPLPFIVGRPPNQAYNLVRVFLTMQFKLPAAESGEKHPDEIPDLSHATCVTENRPVYTASPEVIQQIQAVNQLAAEGRVEEAMQRCRELLDADAANPMALTSLAWLLTTAAKPELRNGGEAVRLATRAVETTHYRQLEPMQVLAAAYAEAGQFPRAIEMARITRTLAFITGQNEIGDRNLKLLGLYSAGETIAEAGLAPNGIPASPDPMSPPP
ncbi:MAG TPA: glycosyltransferase family 39 protein [Candidatus Acidoferrum sp.]|nr:glycosyltransferase family 39 protein [Candidatus Acidoferrum sp.]